MTASSNEGIENRIKSQVDRILMGTDPDSFKDYLNQYAGKLAVIEEYNELLKEIPPESEERYSACVQKIVEATREYYNFLGSLNPEIRSFLQNIGGDVESEEGMAELNAMFGTQLRISLEPSLSVQSIRPKNYIMQIDAITSQLQSLSGSNELRVGGKGTQPVTTTVTLDLPESLQIQGGHQLTTYDKSVINGVTSLIESGNTVFTVPMLYHAMTGKKNPTVDEGLYEELSGKLEQMRRMIISIDLGDEIGAGFIDPENNQQMCLEDPILEGYLLPLNRVTGHMGGKRTEIYQILQYPPLYSYSKMRRQLASVPIRLLNAPLNNNTTTIPLKTYLLQRVEMMKNDNNAIKSNRILYESVYRELDAMESGKTRKMRIRNYTCEILGYFVEQRYISGFEEYKKGRSIEGVRVRL